MTKPPQKLFSVPQKIKMTNIEINNDLINVYIKKLLIPDEREFSIKCINKNL